MYFHAVSLSPTTVQDILSIAHYLQIENLTETCVEFVRERIDKRNAVSVYLYTSLLGPWDLRLTAQEFILQHFEQVAAAILVTTLRCNKWAGSGLGLKTAV